MCVYKVQFGHLYSFLQHLKCIMLLFGHLLFFNIESVFFGVSFISSIYIP